MEYNGPKFITNDLLFIDNDKPGGGFKKVEFLYAIDGDTCNFIIDNKNVRVRFFAIDTPEIKKEQEYSISAKDFVNDKLKNAKEIYLQTDPSDNLYDDTPTHRLLAWVWIDKQLLNYLLVKDGFAKIEYVYTDKLLYLNDLYKAESFAKEKKVNLYSIKMESA